MDQNEMYETQAGMEDSSERLEKKEQLRAKVQALVSYYEDEKRRNEELTMELERLKAEQQQMQGMSGPIGPIGGPGMPPMNGNGMGSPAGGMSPGGFPPAGGVPFAQRPQQAGPYAPQQPFPGAPGMPGAPAPGMAGMPPPGMPGTPMPGMAPDFPPAASSLQAPQGPGGYTLQSFGAPPQGGMPSQRPPMPQQQNPYGAPMPPQGGGPQGMPPFGQGFPPPQPQAPAPQPFGQFPPAQQPFGQPGFGAGPQGMYPPQPPAYQGQGFGLTDNIGTVLQTVTQVRSKLQQFESMRGYGYPQQPTYVDYDTVTLLDKLYNQLGDLMNEMTQRR